ncbi:MAG: Wzz/FepE/Etk N-terminal domain-containing protein [Verrucomicrobiota bacterium]
MIIDESAEKLIKHTVYVFFRRKWMMVTIFGITSVLMLFLTILVTPTYRAATRVLVEHNYKQQLGLFREVTTPGELNTRVNYNNNIISILQSEILAAKIVDEFDLAERLRKSKEEPEHFRDQFKMGIVNFILWPKDYAVEQGWLGSTPDDWRADAIEAFIQETLDVELVEDTEIIEIAIFGESPEMANQMVTRVTKLLIKTLLELNRSEATKAYNFAVSQGEEFRQRYERLRDQVEELKVTLRVASFADEKRLLLEHKESLEEQLTSVRSANAALQEELAEARNQADNARLSPSKREEITSTISDLEITIAGNGGRRENLEINLEQVSLEIDDVIKRENEFSALQNDLNLTEHIYFQLEEKIQELGIQQGSQTGEFGMTVVDRMPVSESADPDWPDLVLFVPVIIVFASGLAVGFPFVLEFFLNYPFRRQELEELTEVPVWGTIPKLKRPLQFLQK